MDGRFDGGASPRVSDETKTNLTQLLNSSFLKWGRHFRWEHRGGRDAGWRGRAILSGLVTSNETLVFIHGKFASWLSSLLLFLFWGESGFFFPSHPHSWFQYSLRQSRLWRCWATKNHDAWCSYWRRLCLMSVSMFRPRGRISIILL